MKFHLVLIVLIVISLQPAINGYVIRILRELLQNGIAGAPVIHERTTWDFDPEISEKRRNVFYEKNGYRAEKFIESIGVGIDGREQERRAEHAVRDEGRLNGEHNINFPHPNAFV